MDAGVPRGQGRRPPRVTYGRWQATVPPRRYLIRLGLILTVSVGYVLAGCSPAGGAAGPTVSATTSEGGEAVDGQRGAGEGDASRDEEEATEISFSELTSDPEAYIGVRIRVVGNVFFFSECPPPGSSNAKCTLLGYLVGPEQRTFIAADTTRAVPLAENGTRVGCDESGESRPACPGWTGDATYTLEGEVDRQVLGGRETSMIRLDVVAKSSPSPW